MAGWAGTIESILKVRKKPHCGVKLLLPVDGRRLRSALQACQPDRFLCSRWKMQDTPAQGPGFFAIPHELYGFAGPGIFQGAGPSFFAVQLHVLHLPVLQLAADEESAISP